MKKVMTPQTREEIASIERAENFVYFVSILAFVYFVGGTLLELALQAF